MDLTGTGISLTKLSYASPYFDLTGSGFATKTGWIGSGTGLLCLDRNGDGQINSGLELFGTAGGATDGFAALGALDSNGDGVIDANDAPFSQLRVWVNPEGDGVVHSGELLTLAQLGIASIDLNATTSTQVINGNAVNLVSTYTLTNGTQRTIGDAWFTTSPTYTRPDTTPALSSDVTSLPELQGYGTMTDLRSAMMADPALESLVRGVASDPGQAPSSLLSGISGIMLEWSGSTSIDPASRGGLFDARQLDFLEKYTGIPFYNASYNDDLWGLPADPRWRAAINLNEGWNNAYDGLTARLLLQSGYSLPEFTYNAAADFVLPSVSLQASFSSLFSRLGDVSASNEGQWEVALRVSDAFRLDAHLAPSAYLAAVASASSDSVAALASALIFGESFSVDQTGAISLTGVTQNSILYAGPAVRLIEVDGVNSQSPPPLGNIIHYDAGSLSLEINQTDYADNPNNALEFGAGITAAQVRVTADTAGNLYLTDGTPGDQVELDNQLSDSAWGVQQVVFADGTTWTRKQLTQLATLGSPKSNTIKGTSGNDLLDGKGGTDTLIGAGGQDTYLFRPSYGHLTIQNASTGTVPAGQLLLGTGLTEQNLWFVQSGNDLVVDVLGTQDQVTVQGWFGSNPSARLAEVLASNGMKLDGQLPQLVSAMASYAANNPGFNPTAASGMPNAPALQSALGAAWHH
ncbi:MAG TPA: calcium-binding protein [Acetobacteraceae bacterium]|nr:calcium-binding protein [Acetobacteraceae bacterium]